ncbi:hypothetical protein SEPCBS119000_003919 [Sporothrix epigloea]|uniref:Uncharacterized protein n=1 Tax=Sporothrix epigloea TaxID=1892477 RepID=A0ABP0DPE1_9PEZI
MADGTYGSPFYQGSISAAGGSAPANKFATNINRNKTRKWVDAKKINYDGSGWGDEDEDEEDGGADEEMPARMPPNAPTQPQHHHQPWRQASPGPANMTVPRTAQIRATSPGTPSAVASPRSGSQPPSGANSPWGMGSKSPLGSRGQSPAGAASIGPGGLGNARGLGGPLGPRNMSPPATGGGAKGPVGLHGDYDSSFGPFKHPVTLNEPSPSIAADESTQRGRSEQPGTTATSTSNPPSLPAATDTNAHPSIPSSDNNIENVTTAESVAQPLPQHKPQDSVGSISSVADDAANDRRYSASPKLPNIARFSTFSPELLFGGSADAPPMPSIPDSPAADTFSMEEPASTSAVAAPMSTDTATERGESTSRDASPLPASSTGNVPVGDARVPADATLSPVHAPTSELSTEEESGVAAGSDKSSVGGVQAAPDLTSAEADAGAGQHADLTSAKPVLNPDPTIAPLNPYRLSGIAPFMPPPVKTPAGPRDMQRTPTMSTMDTPTSTTDSPVKESDVLREEIIRTLSPARMTVSEDSMDGTVTAATDSKVRKEADDESGADATVAAARTEDPVAARFQGEDQINTEHVRSMTGDSTYLQNVYDDYLTREGAPDEIDSAAGQPLSDLPVADAGGPAGAGASGATAFGSVADVHTSDPPTSLPEPQQTVAPVLSPSPGPDLGFVPGAFPGSNIPTPAATQPVPVQAPELRRRFSWETEPEVEQLSTVPAAAAAAVAAHGVSSLPSQQHRTQQQQQAATTAADIRTQSPPTASAEPQSGAPMPIGIPLETRGDLGVSAPADANSTVSAAATSAAGPDVVASAGIDTSGGPTVESQERPESNLVLRPQAQAPVRSMLDVGHDSLQQVPTQEEQQPDNRISTVDSAQSDTSLTLSATNPLSASQTQPHDALVVEPGTVPSLQADQSAPEGAVRTANPALFGSADTGNAQFLTLRQCMAFDQHHERMAKLAETRHEFAVADSGLSSWLQYMTSTPEYSHAAYVPLFENQANASGSQGLSTSASRPVAAVAATISRVPHHVHVAVPSSTQITNKSKEIFSVATGKAGKGLQALRKKGFHKKSPN